MAGRLNGKIAIVTGGASGIGASTARMFAREGAKVVVTDVQDAKGEAVARETGGTFLHQDTSDEAQWTRAIELTLARHGRLDILMNNAGVFMGANIEETSLELWNKVLGINLTGVMLGCKHAIGAMKKNRAGQRAQSSMSRRSPASLVSPTEQRIPRPKGACACSPNPSRFTARDSIRTSDAIRSTPAQSTLR